MYHYFNQSTLAPLGSQETHNGTTLAVAAQLFSGAFLERTGVVFDVAARWRVESVAKAGLILRKSICSTIFVIGAAEKST